VVAPVLEPGEALKKERLAGSLADVPDDSAHPEPPQIRRFACESLSRSARKSPALQAVPASRRSAELASHEGRDGTTEAFGLCLRRGLGEHSHDRLRAGRPHEHAAALAQLAVEALDLLEH